MSENLFATLAIAAISIGSIHSLAPDHWVPFAALARAQRWSIGRTLLVTFVCGFGHVTVSVVLGLLGLAFGLQMLETLGKQMESVSGVLLVAFGLAYGVWGLRNAAGRHLHGHSHVHYDHVHEPQRMTAFALFLLFSADPCVAVIPLLFAATPLGFMRTTVVVVAYEVATIGTMIVLVALARAGIRVLHSEWLDRYGDAAAGGIIVSVGLAVTGLGW